jgi:hypothetical protein
MLSQRVCLSQNGKVAGRRKEEGAKNILWPMIIALSFQEEL